MLPRAPEKYNPESLADLSPEQKRALLARMQREQAGEALSFYPLSHGQRALWFLYQLAPESSAYNVVLAARIHSEVDVGALRSAFQMLVDRHPLLAATFGASAGDPVQQVHKHARVYFEVIDATSWSHHDLEHRLEDERRRPFVLERGPLFRVQLFCQSAHEHILLVVAHHIVIDGLSVGILLNDLRFLYPAAKAHTQPSLQPLARQYWDYVYWQRQILAGPEGDRLWRYWREQLAGASFVLNLPTDRPRPLSQRYCGGSYFFSLPDALTRALYDLARREGATMYMLFLAAFYVLLYRYTGQEDILVGTPAAGRPRTEFEKVVGYFVSPIVLRANLSGNPTFTAFLRGVRETVLAGLAHQDYPFSLLVERLQPERNPNRSPIFQVMLDWQQIDGRLGGQGDNLFPAKTGIRVDVGGLEIEFLNLPQQEGQFDLLFDIFETGDTVFGALRYDTSLFDSATIARIYGHLQSLLEGLIANPEERVAALPLLAGAERQQILFGWNATAADFPKEKCIHELFEEQVERTPEAVAVVFGEESLTYHELNRRANQIAHYLRKLGAGPEILIGVCMERSIEMVVGLLGILKAGGAYVPLDPAYPNERLAFILEDAQVPVLLTQQRLTERLAEPQARFVCLDSEWEVIARESGKSPATPVAPQNLAYLIYTSGSTGRPKGVAIEHRNAVALLDWAGKVFSQENLAGVLASTSICFDLSVFELFLPLCSGGKVILAENLLQLPNLPAAMEVTLINTVPSLISETLRMNGVPSSVRTVSLAGEPLPTSLVEQLYQRDGIRQVWDLYGPSEYTTYSTFALRSTKGPATIGRPIGNTQIYLLDSHLNPVPIGLVGELYIGGAGLARGYLNRPDLTAEKFIPNPFSNEPGTRLYKTGDLARYLPDGNIEFLGRSDYQVKIRGFRIELGEIETVLCKHPGVREAVVVVQEDVPGEKRLLAYFVPAREPAPSSSELRLFLRKQLPGPMVPWAFVRLDALPLTPNGKVDRRALPAPDQATRETAENHVVPRTPWESLIAEIWQDLLGVDRVGVYDNFFDLGGHSLLSLRFVAQLEKTTGLRIHLTEIMYQTLGQLAATCEERMSPGPPPSSGLTQRVLGRFSAWLPGTRDRK